MKLRRKEVGRGRRSGTVWRRRSLGSTAAGKTRYGGSWKNSRTQHLFVLRRLDPCVRPTPPVVGTRLSTGCLMQCA
jgi:hypothetical protein